MPGATGARSSTACTTRTWRRCSTRSATTSTTHDALLADLIHNFGDAATAITAVILRITWHSWQTVSSASPTRGEA